MDTLSLFAVIYLVTVPFVHIIEDTKGFAYAYNARRYYHSSKLYNLLLWSWVISVLLLIINNGKNIILPALVALVFSSVIVGLPLWLFWHANERRHPSAYAPLDIAISNLPYPFTFLFFVSLALLSSSLCFALLAPDTELNSLLSNVSKIDVRTSYYALLSSQSQSSTININRIIFAGSTPLVLILIIIIAIIILKEIVYKFLKRRKHQ